MNKFNQSEIEDIIALSPQQEKILFQYLKADCRTKYVNQLIIELKGITENDLIFSAWNYLVKKYQMLRTVFRWEGLNKPVQVILKEKIINYEQIDIPENENSIGFIHNYLRQRRSIPFVLEEETLRILIFNSNSNKKIMTIINHHIIYDGWSNSILLESFFYRLNGFKEREDDLNEFQYKEYLKLLHRNSISNSYWNDYYSKAKNSNKLSNELHSTKLNFDVEFLNKEVSGDSYVNIKNFLKQNKIFLSSFIYSIWCFILQKYTNRNEVSFGITLSGRETPIKGIERAIGLYINTIPLYYKINQDLLVINYINEIQELLFELLSQNQVNNLTEADSNKTELNTLVVIENYPINSVLLRKDTSVSLDSFDIVENTNFDILVTVNELENLQIKFTYNNEKFNSQGIKSIFDSFLTTINLFINQSESYLSQINLLSKSKNKSIVPVGAQTSSDFYSIIDLFYRNICKHTDEIAIQYKNNYISFGYLDEWSNQLANKLQLHGIKKGSLVAVLFERSPELIISIFAILKAGAAFVPISPSLPIGRIQKIVSDCTPSVILTLSDFESCLGFQHNSVVIDILKNFNSDLNNSRVNVQVNMDDIAYVMYTSGTTGKPKGIIIEHASISNLIIDLDTKYPFTGQDTYLFKTPIMFDVSLTEIFGWIIQKGKVLVLADNSEKSPDAIIEEIKLNYVTHINFVPSMYQFFIDSIESRNQRSLNSLKYIFLAGEKLLNSVISSTWEKLTNIELVNLYGPTEATVYASYYNISKYLTDEIIPIGRPIIKTNTFVFDKLYSPQPINIKGELYLTGLGLARGYLNLPELTDSAFINRDNLRLYKTGDISSLNDKGELICFGRDDNQIKIRGNRVELAEIENLLQQKESIRDAVVVVKEVNGDNKICAFVLSKDDNIDETVLKRYLKDHLPNYMIPSWIIKLDSFPMNNSGKTDRGRLVRMNHKLHSVNKLKPKNTLESLVLECFDSTGISLENREEKFFELGVTSFELIQLSKVLSDKFNRFIPSHIFFQYTNFNMLIRYMQETNDEKEDNHTENFKRKTVLNKRLQRFNSNSVE